MELEMLHDKLNSSSSTGTMKRNVSFSDQCDIRHIESQKSLSKKEKKTRWMMDKDFVRIREDCDNEMMQLFSSQKPFMRTDIRGLELFDPETICRSRSKHRKVVNAVIRMQSKQQSEGALNPESIREMYGYLAQDSQDDARAIAWIDREVVQDYMATTMTEIEKLREKQQQQDSPKSVTEQGRSPFRNRILRTLRKPKKAE